MTPGQKQDMIESQKLSIKLKLKKDKMDPELIKQKVNSGKIGPAEGY